MTEDGRGAVGPWRAAGRAVRGAQHRRRGLPVQDAVAWRAVPGGVALAVADGHGSAASPHSDVGARLAVETAIALLGESEFTDAGGSPERLARELTARWRSAVRSHAERHGFEPAPAPAGAGGDDDGLLLRYGSTLLGALATPRELLYCQLGDGDILLVSPSGHVRRPWGRDRRLLGGETTSLCMPEAWREVRVGRQSFERGAPALVLLATDGYANSFRTERGFMQVGRDILSLVRTHGVGRVEGELEAWLEEVSRLGSGDDVSAAFLYRSEVSG